MAFATTTQDVIEGVDLSEMMAVVTGATTGLGYETVRTFASAGAHVVMCGRSAEKCEVALAAIRDVVPLASLESEAFDLADLSTVRVGADTICSRHPPHRSARQQRRRDVHPRRSHRRWIRDPVRHQPPRAFRVDDS